MAIGGQWEKCWKCKADMWLPSALYEAAQAARGKISFYCAYGHGQIYAEGEAEETKLRRERDQLKQEQARLLDNLNASERNRQRAELTAIEAQASERKAKKTLVSLKKRAAAGVCPCCNRTFSALAQHVATKHPTFRAEDVAHENIVSIVKAKRA